ncbi:MAG: hypothetical protein KAS76_02270 [Thermoplasmatales archaeon]|nr:hypothetical protein [Thermoplasmatales archaeon]MCK4995264.1 hypothetical protein [Thermoplasmatales archaeon]
MRRILPLLVVGILVLTGLGASATPLLNIDAWEQKVNLNIFMDDELD